MSVGAVAVVVVTVALVRVLKENKMKISKTQIQQIIKEELQKILNEDSFKHERDHDEDNIAHLRRIRREMDHHLDALEDQYHRSERREHDYHEDY